VLPEDAIRLEGRVIEVLPHHRVRVELANRHRLLARISRPLQARLTWLSVGDIVTLELSPYDMSKGQVIAQSVNKEHESPRVS
jgi:translation initiation factor IF-1